MKLLTLGQVAASNEIPLNRRNKYCSLILDPNHFFQRSDHYNFAKHNIPVIFYFNGTHEDYHKHTDTVDKIDFLKLSNITRLIYYTTWELSNKESRIVLD